MSCLSSADQIDLCDGHGVILLHQSLFTIAPACLSIQCSQLVCKCWEGAEHLVMIRMCMQRNDALGTGCI